MEKGYMMNDSFIDVERKIKKKNKILFNKESTCLHQLIPFLGQLDHKAQILWALDCAHTTLTEFERIYPHDKRPFNCLEKCDEWARGNCKMNEAKKAILLCHSIAKEIEDEEGIALVHAIGQAGSTVHVGTHALGLIFYELTAIVIHNNYSHYEEFVNEKINFYMTKALYWQEHTKESHQCWASFL